MSTEKQRLQREYAWDMNRLNGAIGTLLILADKYNMKVIDQLVQGIKDQLHLRIKSWYLIQKDRV